MTKVGMKNTVGGSTSMSVKEKTSATMRSDFDLLKIPHYIEQKYGKGIGMKLAWVATNNFGDGFNGENWALIKKDAEDSAKFPSLLGISQTHAQNSAYQDYFLNGDLVLANMPIAKYDTMKRYDRDDSLRKRANVSDVKKTGGSLNKTGSATSSTIEFENVELEIPTKKSLAEELNNSVE